ncbi:MAG: DUF5719 family protein, partial [Actinomycetota bacterium]
FDSIFFFGGSTWSLQYQEDNIGLQAVSAVDSMHVWAAGIDHMYFGGQNTNLSTWYLAEGTTDWGFYCLIIMENPNDEEVTVQVTYMTPQGPVIRPEITLAPTSVTYLDPSEDLGAEEFSTKVECLEGKTIAVQRTMLWAASGQMPEGHTSIGVTAPAKTWYLPEGSSKWGFECWLLIQNPSSTDASCDITYMIEGAGPATFTETISANSRCTFSMFDYIGAQDASIRVQANVPVIPERAMYRNGRREGHDSIGTTTPSTDYYLAEGTTDWGFTTYVLVQNPNSTPANVDITYMTDTGPVSGGSFAMDANSRKTICVNDWVVADLSTRVHSNKPIIAERAMYWDSGYGEACHDSIGLSAPHKCFYLPDGETSAGDPEQGYPDGETWTLVQNPNAVQVSVRIDYFGPEGYPDYTVQATIPANSRKTFSMADVNPEGTAAIKVECTTADKKIMAEQAMYIGWRCLGVDTIGGYSD